MGKMADRLKRLQAAADERGPVEAEAQEDEQRVPLMLARLDPLPPSDVFPEDPVERARVAGGNAGLDCETCLIQPGRAAPRLVVTGYQNTDGTQFAVTGAPAGYRDVLAHATAFLAFTERLIKDAQEKGALAICGACVDGLAVVAGDGEEAQKCPACLGHGLVGVRDAWVGGLLVNQNIPFDFCAIAEAAHQADVELGLVGHEDSWFDRVMRRIFLLLDAGLVEDPMLRERLIDIAEGTLDRDFEDKTEKGTPRRKKYTLKASVKRYLGVDLDKFTFRLGYSQYLDRPLDEYEPGARDYLTDDVEGALQVAQRQQERAIAHGLPEGKRLPNSAEQSKAAFGLALMSDWGVRTDLAKVQQLDADLDRVARQLIGVLKETGLVRATGRDAGTRDVKRTRELVKKAYEDAGLEVPRTPGGDVSTAGAVLEDIALITLRGSAADVLDKDGRVDETELYKQPLYAYSQYVSVTKLQNTYLHVLYEGTRRPINASYGVIRETGRTACSGPNLQNLPRGGIKTLLQRLQALVRECYVPRDGYVFCTVDYNVAELCALAQVCLWLVGESKLAEALNAGVDPHLLLAAEQLLHMSYEEAIAHKKDPRVADMRQLAKPANFGFPGGLGAASFVEFAKSSYNVYLSEEESRDLKQKWLAQWPEMRAYFRRVSDMMRGYDDRGQPVADIEQLVSGRIRGRVRYTAACNSFFQGLVADAAKEALYNVQKECFLLGGRMYGARPVVFVHDEVIAELPRDVAHEYAMVQTEVMIKTMQSMCPDVRIKAEPALMDCWYKGAEAVYDRRGRLTSWRPGVKYEKDENGRLVEPFKAPKQLAEATA